MELNIEVSENIEDHCFACLGKNETMQDLSNYEEPLAIFKNIFNFEIVLEEGTPKFLCYNCEDNLNKCLQFYRQVENCIQYILEYKDSIQVKLEENITISVTNDSFSPPDQDNNSESDSDEEPLSRIAKKKAPFNQKLKKIPLEIIEDAIEKYRNKCKENSDCIVCDFVGINIRNLSCHMKHKHKEEKDCWCSRCNMLFEDIKKHQKTHTNFTWCKFCKKNVTRCHYLEHLKSHAGLEFSCDDCEKKFISQKSLDEHKAQHKNTKPFQCPNCQKCFKLLTSLEDHISLHGRYTCRYCEKHFEIPESLSSHLCNGKILKEREIEDVEVDVKNESQKEEEEHEGEYGNKDWEVEWDEDSTPVKLKEEDLNHAKSVLEPKKIEDLTCHFCQRTYKTAYKLKLHIEGHMGIFSAVCSWCNKGFTCKADLINHERTHTKEKPFMCNVCGKKLSSGATLRIHLKQHTGRPEECEICHKRFCRKSELKLHLQKHRGERPFLCTDCGKSFAQKSHLTCHLTMHSDERPFQCKACNKSFKKKELLKHHIKLHGEKKFKCTVCFYECHKNYRLQQHMKMHEGKVDSKVNICQLCSKGFSSVPLLNSHMCNVHNVIV